MKFCCISRLYSYRKKLYCVHVVPFFLWYQKSGHSGLEGILNWWWRNITKRKTDKHVPFPTCPFPLKSTDFVTLPAFATPTIGEEKINIRHAKIKQLQSKLIQRLQNQQKHLFHLLLFFHAQKLDVSKYFALSLV